MVMNFHHIGFIISSFPNVIIMSDEIKLQRIYIDIKKSIYNVSTSRFPQENIYVFF